jgi:hypothetical protein
VLLLRRFVLAAALALVTASAVASAASAGWSGQNGRVVFNTANGCCDRIWTVNADGSDVRVIISSSSQYARIEDISPDGTQIVYLDTERNNIGQKVRSIAVDTAPLIGRGTLLDDPPDPEEGAESLDRNTRYSPEGTRIAFLRTGVDPGVWVMDADGTHKQLVLASAAPLTDLAWSPDGTRLGFRNSGLPYSIPADGTSVPVAMLDAYPPSPGRSPVSPDGLKKVFVDCCDADMGGNPEVYLSNPDGSGRVRLTGIFPGCTFPVCGTSQTSPREGGFDPFMPIWQTVYAPTSRAGLVAAYNFDAGAGTMLADLSGNGNTGKTRATAWTTGLHGGALAFNGHSSWVTIAESPSLALSDAMTLEAWVRPTQLSDDSWKSVIFKEQRKSTEYDLYASDGKVPAASVWNGGEQLAKGSSQLLPLDRWSHLAATLGGGALRLYLNGNLIATEPNAASIVRDRSSKPLRLGGNDVFDEFFAGAIDDVRIYNRALSESELRSDMFTAVS